MDSSQIDLGAGKVHTNSTFNHISKRQKLGTEVEDEPTVDDDGTDVEDSAEDSDEGRDSSEDKAEDSAADSDGYQDSDEEEIAERRDEAMRCECVSCSEPHPDPEQLIEDIRLHGITRYADFPSKRDTNGWRVISDNWSQGICPDCKDDVLACTSGQRVLEEESTDDEDEDEDEESTEEEESNEDEEENEDEGEGEDADEEAWRKMSTEHPTWRCGKHGLKLLGPYPASAALGLGIVMMPAQPFFRCPRQGHDGCTNQGGLRGANGYGCPPL